MHYLLWTGSLWVPVRGHRKGQRQLALDCSEMQLKYAFEFYCIALGAPKMANFMREQLIKRHFQKGAGSAVAKWKFCP